ncbi:apoptotic chromatin condensation inducer in the nucleus [Aplysia californica]|uniref:Apoptotic chromatin condensation inducer in the nucleus n=1 Tax=Aplysia californica TaxID=6500 RepID=A0ABM0JCJ2_APLCA|nr:apoptotic chromatin condensation inducer in the nucleus [Aplysia californica]XP_005090563.1 apoptotic chromatin condensation inducer in the nucleus [Aplysia californica]
MASEEDSSSSITFKGTPVTELKLNDIKRELERRGLSKAGSKTQLIDRLKAQLLLEKLQQDAAQSSGDELSEGKVPNMALQDDKAGQNEFVRQYLQQQQRNLEIQMEVKKQVEEERKRKSADESSADEANVTKDEGKASAAPDVTSPKKFKDDSSNAPAKEVPKMPRPARKSSRNASKGLNENGQEGDAVTKNQSRSPTPEGDRIRERTRSGSSSSSRSPSPEKSTRGRRGRPRRGRAKKSTGKRGGHQTRKDSPSSSPPSSPGEVMPKKKQRRSTNSISSRSRSRSPQMVSPEAPTRRSSRRVSAAQKSASDQSTMEEVPDDGGGDGLPNKTDDVDSSKGPTAVAEAGPVKDAEPEAESKTSEKNIDTVVSGAGQAVEKSGTVQQTAEDDDDTDPGGSTPPPVLKPAAEEETVQTKSEEKAPAGRLSRWRSSKSKTGGQEKDEASEKNSEPVSGQTLVTDAGDSSSKKGDFPGVEQGKSASEPAEKQVETSKDSPGELESLKDSSKKASNISEAKPKRSQSSDSSRSKSRSPSAQRKRSVSRSRSRSSSSGSSTDTGANKTASSSSVVKRDSSPKGSSKPAATDDVMATVEEKSVSKKADTQEASGESASVTTGDDVTMDTGKPSASVDDKDIESTETASKNDAESKPSDVKEDDAVSVVVTGKETDQAQDTPEQEDKSKKEKGVKKRKWGSKTSKAAKTTKRTTSMEISSDSLKGLIGEVKLTETVFDMETEVVNTLDYEPEEDRRDIKMKRTIVQDSPEQMEVDNVEDDARTVEAREDVTTVEETAPPADTEKKIIKITSAAPKEGGKKLKEIKKGKKKKEEDETLKEDKAEGKKAISKDSKERITATTRPAKPLLPAVDEPEPVGTGSQSPARNPVDRVIRIACLVRPFTVNQLKELLRRSGELDEEYFWINDIKSHCLAAYKTEEDAVKARSCLHGTKWPQSNPKILVVDYATLEDVEHRKAEDAGVPIPPKKQEEQRKPVEKKEDDERKKAREQREKEREERDKEAREKREGDRQRRRELEKKNPVREWDRDKIQQLSRSRSRSKEDERPLRRSRSRSRDRERQKRREQSREKKDEDRRKEKKQKETKAEEEPPAKLLDDLFRKTKATPCIYWLPLTEEQALQRQVKKQEQEKERQKRRAALEEKEKEEQKKREAAREERQREREREREKEREKERARSRDRERERDRGRQERARSSESRSRSRSRRRR